MENLHLTDRDRAILDGGSGRAAAAAMGLLIRYAEALGAPRMIDITSAHIDGCLFHGLAGLQFAERLVALDGRVQVPTTLNVATLDRLHPDLYRGPSETAVLAGRLMDAYEAMGCTPTWTCAPYHLQQRPAVGEDVAWAESNAIVFANSVLGARTARYGDFVDICAALTGRVPYAGLHVPEARRASVVIDVQSLDLVPGEVSWALLGHSLGLACPGEVPAIVGVGQAPDEDDLKALGAAAASSGDHALIHVVGHTPEAPDLEAVLATESRRLTIGQAEIQDARRQLTTASTTALSAVSTGTPHASLDHLRRIVARLAGRPVRIDAYVSVGRDVAALAAGDGTLAALEESGWTIVTDTCTYITPILRDTGGAVMTDSAKWAWYAPGNLGVDVVFGSLDECVESAVTGRVISL